MDTETFEELLSDAADLEKIADAIETEVRGISSVEKAEDFKACVEEALETASLLVKELKALRRRAALKGK